MSDPQGTPEDSVQRQIIQAAQQLFQVYGLHKVTMDDVAREIGKRRSSLYYYYKNKEEILDAAIDVEMRELLSELADAVDQADSFEQKLTTYCTTRLKISQKRRELYNVVESAAQAGDMSDFAKVRQTMHERWRQMEIPLVRKILEAGIGSGDIRALDSKEQETLIVLLLSSLQGFKRELIFKKQVGSVEPAISMLVYMITRGFKP